MSLPLRLLLAAAVVLAAPAAAHAEKTLAEGEKLVAEVAIPDGENPLDADVVSEGAAGYPLEKRFGLGRCLCSAAGAEDPERKYQFAGKFDVDPDPTQQYDGTVLVFTGTGCDGTDMTSRIANCGEDPLDTLPDINQLPQGRFYPVHKLISPTANTCPTDLENDRVLYAFIDK